MATINELWEAHKQAFLQEHGVQLMHQVGLPDLLLGIIRYHGFEKLLNEVTVAERFEMAEVAPGEPKVAEAKRDRRMRKQANKQASSPETVAAANGAERPPVG